MEGAVNMIPAVGSISRSRRSLEGFFLTLPVVLNAVGRHKVDF